MDKSHLQQRNTIFIIGALALGAWWYVGSYYQVNVSSSLIFRSDDGSCTPVSQQVGIHCFGDYSATALRAMSNNPWSPDSTYAPYLAGGYVLPRLTASVGEIFANPGLGLLLYQILAIGALTLPTMWLNSRTKMTERFGPNLLIIGPASVPALMALDRGNNVAFVVPGLLLLILGIAEDNHRMTILGICLAAFFKPQFIILVLLLVALRRWRQALLSFSATALSQLCAYLFWPNAIPNGLIRSFESIVKYNSYASITDSYPPQISIGRGVHIILGLIFEIEQKSAIVNAVQATSGAIVVVIFFLVAFVRCQRIPIKSLTFAFVALTALFPGTTWAYYSVFVIPLVAVSESEIFKLQRAEAMRSSASEWLLTFTLAFTIFQFPISLNHLDGMPGVVPTSAAVVPILWSIYAFLSLSTRQIGK